ncbi:hypothetical protein ACFOW1_01735 [Parasediminibacterium paludis]|uniref:Uncharacterized protein n=1 Tax=Parasediminibacterium paludis TaxID=908966 RepID=A0ABV8PR06_9BACT
MKTKLQHSTNVHSERSTPPDAKHLLGEYPLANMSKNEFFKKVRTKRFITNYHPIQYAYVVTIDFEKLVQVKATPPFVGYQDKYPEKSFVSFSSAHSAKNDAWDEIRRLLQGFA